MFSFGRYMDKAEFHSIMYKASDVVHPDSPRGGCSSQRLHDMGGLNVNDHPLGDQRANLTGHHERDDQSSFLFNKKIHPKLLASNSPPARDNLIRDSEKAVENKTKGRLRSDKVNIKLSNGGEYGSDSKNNSRYNSFKYLNKYQVFQSPLFQHNKRRKR